jgi:hypothetical protein
MWRQRVQGHKKQKIKEIEKEDLNALCKDKSTTTKFQKIDFNNRL